ncbi:MULTISPECIES: hypothetical protein [unclassified Streptomyces]|uniref:hypothetical protein n=1 Tax=unclassified Streptomyces TaxID=2593676 RepID=UPI00068F6A76
MGPESTQTPAVGRWSVIGAIGPAGQCRITPVWATAATAATADAVRRIADRLEGAGPAVPDSARATVAAAVRQVRVADVAVLGPGVAALTMSD